MIDLNRNGKFDPADTRISISVEQQRENRSINLLGYPFTYVQELSPERNLLGQIKQYDPKENYSKKASTPLNKYGNGPFCRFSLKAKGYRGIPGVYAMFDNQNLLYIGQTENFEQRFNTGYGIIAPRNCYIGGQNTNCKINSMILSKYLNGDNVHLYFFETFDFDRVEHELIQTLQPPLNGSIKTSFAERPVSGTIKASIFSRKIISSKMNTASLKTLFEQYIYEKISSMATAYVDINSGDIHRAVGGYPGKNHHMPTCCDVMYKLMKGTDEVVSSPPSGKGASLTIRYYKKNH